MKLFRFVRIRTFFVQLFLCASLVLVAQSADVAAYYEPAGGKADAELKTALHEIVKVHKKLNYSAVAYDFFERYDLTPEGYIWDMYAEPRHTRWSGSGMNREHNLPKSWFGISGGSENKEAIGCDYHNLYPSDAKANSAKSNYPLGETGGERFNNGISKVGKNTYPGYSDIVFEPADEYKGDFARCYMYMVTCYEDYATRWTALGVKSMLTNTTYPTFSKYAVNLLMEWHREDPVSKKETDRNNNVYTVQGNRNPFVDYPELAEFIWGDKKGVQWEPSVDYRDFTVTRQGNLLLVEVSTRSDEEVHYEIYGVNGMKMQSGTLASDKTISIDRLASGMYVLAVYAADRRHVARFAK